MPVIIPKCSSCKNFKEKNKNGHFCCTAFPDGIPDEYFWGPINVKEINTCNKNIGFIDVYDK